MPGRITITVLLRRMPAHQEAQDARSWNHAAQETGHPLRVLWGEILQLVPDIFSRRTHQPGDET